MYYIKIKDFPVPVGGFFQIADRYVNITADKHRSSSFPDNLIFIEKTAPSGACIKSEKYS